MSAPLPRLTLPWPVPPKPVKVGLPSARDLAAAGDRLLGLELLGEDRAAELAPDALDEVVDELLGDTGRDAGQTARRALRGHAGEGVHDTHRGAEEADERRGRADGRQDA